MSGSGGRACGPDAVVGASLAEREVDVPDRQVDVAAARSSVSSTYDASGIDGEAELLGERRGHDDQRQAVAGARGKGLRRVARLAVSYSSFSSPLR